MADTNFPDFVESGGLLAGTVYAADLVNDVEQGWLPLGNVKEFTISPNSTELTRPSFKRGERGEDLDAIFLKESFDTGMVLDTLNKESIAIFMQGSASVSVVTGATITDEQHTAHIGKAIATSKGGISAVVVKDVTAVTTYVEGTDYRIEDSFMGFITPLAGGAISEDDVIKVTFTHATRTSDSVVPQQEGGKEIALKINGYDDVRQLPYSLYIGKYVIGSEGDFNFIGEELMEFGISGKMVKLPTWSKSFVLDFNIVDS